MMKKFGKFLREHKKGALIGLFVVMVFIGCSAVSAVHVAQSRLVEQDQAKQAEQAEQGGPEAVGPNVVALNASQQALIDAYDDDTKKLIETLSASVWVANGGNDTVRFYDNQYSETFDGMASQHSYAISRIDDSMSDAGEKIYTIVFETDDGTHVVTYTYHSGAAADGSGQILSTISSSSMFNCINTTYEARTAVESITIKGLNSEVTQMLGGDADKFTEALSTYCASNYPTATEATWDQIAFVDYETGVVSTNFTLDTEAKTTIAATYNKDTGTFSFGR